MMTPSTPLRASGGALLVALTVAVTGFRASAQTGDLALVLGGLAERTQQYYDRFISIICTETVHQQDLRFNLAPTGRPRTTVYELSVSRDPGGTGERVFRIDRTLQQVNGRPARRNQRPGCTDPKTGSPEPLAFLLAENQSRYRFTLDDAGPGAFDNIQSRSFDAPPSWPPGTRAIDFVESPPERVRIKWEGNCFEAEGGGYEGRVWFDPDNYDVLQIAVRLSKPFLVPLRTGYIGVEPAIRVERSETTIRFSRVEFQQPDETVLLPESIDTLTVFRGAPSLKTTQKLSGFRRFLTKSEIRPSSY
jgi:hypothetical protein